jgi:hypothetical protein
MMIWWWQDSVRKGSLLSRSKEIQGTRRVHEDGGGTLQEESVVQRKQNGGKGARRRRRNCCSQWEACWVRRRATLV